MTTLAALRRGRRLRQDPTGPPSNAGASEEPPTGSAEAAPAAAPAAAAPAAPSDTIVELGVVQSPRWSGTVDAAPPVYASSAAEFQAALEAQDANVVITAHLDLRGLERKPNPVLEACLHQSFYENSPGYTGAPPELRSHVAYVSNATRAIRGECGDPVPEEMLEAWRQHVPGALLPLKRGQCLVLATSKALFAQDGDLWLHNLYLATLPHGPTRQSLLLSTGYEEVKDLWPDLDADKHQSAPGWPGCTSITDLRMYMTDVVMHAAGPGGSRVVALMPMSKKSSVSLLAHDSVFVGFSGMTPPFLVPHFSRAVFSNCLFRDIYVQGHELFDVSHGGGVRLTRCRFANVTAGVNFAASGDVELAGTSYNALAEPQPECEGFWDHDFDGQPNVRLLAARPEDRAIGADWWVEQQDVVDANTIDWRQTGVDRAAAEQDCSPIVDGRTGNWLSETDEWLRWVQETFDVKQFEETEAFIDGLPACPNCTLGLSAAERAQRAERAGADAIVPPLNLSLPPPVVLPPTPNPDRAADTVDPTVAAIVSAAVALVAAAAALVLFLLHRRQRRRAGIDLKDVHCASKHPTSTAGRSSGRPGGTSPRGVRSGSSGNPVHSHPQPAQADARYVPGGVPPHSLSTAHSVQSTASSHGVGDDLGDMFQYRLPPGLSLLGPRPDNPDPHNPDNSGHGSLGVLGSVGGSMGSQSRRSSRAISRLVDAALAPAGGSAAQGNEKSQHDQSALDVDEEPRTHAPQHAAPPQHPGEVPERARKAAARRPPRGHVYTTEESEDAETGDVGAGGGPDPAAGCCAAPEVPPSQAPVAGMWPAEGAGGAQDALRMLHRQLDRFMPSDKFLGRFEMLGRWERRQGGQSVVQFARDDAAGASYAVKFFTDVTAFHDEVAIYATCMPAFTTVYRPSSFDRPRRPRPPPRVGNDPTSMAPSCAAAPPAAAAVLPAAAGSSTTTLTRAGSSMQGTLHAVSAAYSIGTKEVSSIGSSMHASQSISNALPQPSSGAGSTGGLSVRGRGCALPPRAGRRLSARHMPALPLGLVNIGEDDPATTAGTTDHVGVSATSLFAAPAASWPQDCGKAAEKPETESLPEEAAGCRREACSGGHAKEPAVAAVAHAWDGDERQIPDLKLQLSGFTDASLCDGLSTDGSGSLASGGSTPRDDSAPDARHTVNGTMQRKPKGHSTPFARGAATEPPPDVSTGENGDASAHGEAPHGRRTYPESHGTRAKGPVAAGLAPMEGDVGSNDDAAGGPGPGWPRRDASIPAAAAKFLPQVEAVCEAGAADLVDPRGRPLPPCIVMEKGESLHDWSSRAEPDLFACVSVLSNVAQRVADMHDVGLVHRDLKPGNVMWLPRQNRWTVIDFGSAARAGSAAALSFTLAYAAPEVVAAVSGGARSVRVTPAVDAWAVGVMAYELLTGAPAFRFLTDGTDAVIAQLRGDAPLPWEGELTGAVKEKLGIFRGPVLQLLQRDPAARGTLRQFSGLCQTMFE